MRALVCGAVDVGPYQSDGRSGMNELSETAKEGVAHARARRIRRASQEMRNGVDAFSAVGMAVRPWGTERLKGEDHVE